jgi:hypothetical protein
MHIANSGLTARSYEAAKFDSLASATPIKNKLFGGWCRCGAGSPIEAARLDKRAFLFELAYDSRCGPLVTVKQSRHIFVIN